jgi:hypothetical protein
MNPFSMAAILEFTRRRYDARLYRDRLLKVKRKLSQRRWDDSSLEGDY